MSIMVMPVNFFNFVDIIKLLENNNILIEQIIKQFEFLKIELKKSLIELDKEIENYNYKFIENSDTEHLYELFDLQKENLKKLLNYLKVNSDNKELYRLVDDIYTLTLQLEDRISTLESYNDIEKLKANV